MIKKGDLESIDKTIQVFDIVTLIAIVLTVVAAVPTFYFKTVQAELLKEQRKEDELKIANANASAEIAKNESAQAIKEAAEATKRAEESKENAAKAELKSKELEKDLLILRLAALPRHVPDFIKDKLRDRLTPFHGKQVIISGYYATDEVKDFSNALGEFFRSVGWRTEVRNQRNWTNIEQKGIKIFAHGTVNEALAKDLRDAFLSIKYPCDFVSSPEADNFLLIQVFGK